jgi:AcrR family transcriptional regulator
MSPNEQGTARPPLNRERILEAAVRLADRAGLDALTMRRLGSELGVEAMSLYNHLAGKDEILDGIVELVIGEIEIPDEGEDWKKAMRRRAHSAREVLRRHSWAIGLMEARGSMGPAGLRYLNAILGNLRNAGFTLDGAAHAFWLLDSYVYGHVVQETSLQLGASHETGEEGGPVEEVSPVDYPHLVALAERAAKSAFIVDGEFAFGLDLILDALDQTAK